KRYTFDLERPTTTLGELIENDINNHVKPSAKAAFDQRYYHKKVSSHELWKDYLGHKAGVSRTFTKEQAMQLFRKAQSGYVDCHCNIFEPESFKEYIEISSGFGMHNFYVKNFRTTEPP